MTMVATVAFAGAAPCDNGELSTTVAFTLSKTIREVSTSFQAGAQVELRPFVVVQEPLAGPFFPRLTLWAIFCLGRAVLFGSAGIADDSSSFGCCGCETGFSIAALARPPSPPFGLSFGLEVAANAARMDSSFKSSRVS